MSECRKKKKTNKRVLEEVKKILFLSAVQLVEGGGVTESAEW